MIISDNIFMTACCIAVIISLIVDDWVTMDVDDWALVRSLICESVQ